MEKIGVMFVCLGNICRSPLAEALFDSKLDEHNLASYFEVESSGTASYHIGEVPDERTIAVAKKHNVP
ncbi:MAG: low molecular weight phosphotyrosine protein phosphatase, partial [Bacteroidia bacterium]|nr:low molecular weight phosphotyrosine protein phosphatase [Bacteroidia bacterium]